MNVEDRNSLDRGGGATVIARHYLVVGLAVAVVVLAGCAGAEARQPGVAKAATEVSPALIGSSLPSLALLTPDGRKVELRQTLAARPTVLVVYRGNWCVYCQKQLADLQRIELDLLALGYQIVAVSPDSPEELRQSIKNAGLKYQLLSDGQLSLIKALGLAFYVDEETRLRMEMSGGVIPRNVSSQPGWMLPVPAVFIVSTDGRIRWEYVNPDYRERVPPDVLMTAARALIAKPAP
jgi:peroxiredoxin